MSEGRLKIAAVGAGRMGRGIAHVFAYAGFPVSLIDLKMRPEEEARRLLDQARGEIGRDLEFLAGLGIMPADRVDTVLDHIRWLCAGEADAALAEADIIFEAVRELEDAKADALGTIGRVAGADAIVSSTTSTLPVATLAGMISGPERFINAHWLNPAYLMPLVEVSPGPATADETVAAVVGLLKSAGKVPVVCSASPGYIVPRLQAAAMNEAARMVEEGVATAAEIDTAVRAGFGVRYTVLGLLEFVDFGGGDILYYATKHLHEALGSARFEMPEIVKRNMAEGKLGMDAGQGFYDFRDVDVEAYRRDKLGDFVKLLAHLDLLPKGDS